MGAETSVEENDNLPLKTAKICREFFKNPTLDNFEEIKSKTYSDTASFELFKISARKRWDLVRPLTKSETLFLNLKEDLLLSPGTKLSVDDLDCLWCLYHATGDNKYLEPIKRAKGSSDGKIAGLASLTYKNFIGEE